MQIIDLALALGILTQITKLGDLLFRENQKKAIQDKTELLTLKLEYAKPLDWFFSIFEKKKLRIILIIVSLLPAALMSLQFYSIGNEADSGRILLFTVLSSAVLLIPTWLGFKYYGLKILNWMTKGKKWLVFISRYLAFVFGFVLAIMPFQLIILIPIFNEQEPNMVFYIIYSSVMILSGAMMVWWVITVAGYFFIAYRLVLFVLEYCFKATTWLLWRIIEYNKGVIAAVTLIITVLLGIVSLVTKIQ